MAGPPTRKQKVKRPATSTTSPKPRRPLPQLSTILPSLPPLLLLSLLSHLSSLPLSALFGSGPSTAYTTHASLALVLLSSSLPLPEPAVAGEEAKPNLAIEVLQVLEMVGRALGIHSKRWMRFSGGWSDVLGPRLGPLGCWAGIGGLAVWEFGLRMRKLQELYSPPSGLASIYRLNVTWAGWLLLGRLWSRLFPQMTEWTFSLITGISLLLLFLSSPIVPPSLSPSIAASSPSPTATSQAKIPARFPRFFPLALALGLVHAFGVAPTSASYPILSSVQSVTGLIQVGENKAEGQSYRWLRADHSLLGGRWSGEKARVHGEKKDQSEEAAGDSIFSTFVMQEGVRLVKRPPPPQDSPLPDPERALIIGLGAGISARAFILHNLSTTIVEYDPAVYTAARTYFSLPEPDHVFLEDANEYVQRISPLAKEGMAGKFSYVIHDVFTGGSVPGELFSLGFWSDLKEMMESNGVLAVNFAGIRRSAATTSVIKTLLASFPQCQAFRDTLGEATKADEQELRNTVIFCTPYRASVHPISLRRPTPADELSSGIRQSLFPSFAKHRIDIDLLTAEDDESAVVLLQRGTAGEVLGKMQSESWYATWYAMRKIMPMEMWNRW